MGVEVARVRRGVDVDAEEVEERRRGFVGGGGLGGAHGSVGGADCGEGAWGCEGGLEGGSFWETGGGLGLTVGENELAVGGIC